MSSVAYSGVSTLGSGGMTRLFIQISVLCQLLPAIFDAQYKTILYLIPHLAWLFRSPR